MEEPGLALLGLSSQTVPGRKPAGGLLIAEPERNAENQTGGQERNLLDQGTTEPEFIGLLAPTLGRAGAPESHEDSKGTPILKRPQK